MNTTISMEATTRTAVISLELSTRIVDTVLFPSETWGIGVESCPGACAGACGSMVGNCGTLGCMVGVVLSASGTCPGACEGTGTGDCTIGALFSPLPSGALGTQVPSPVIPSLQISPSPHEQELLQSNPHVLFVQYRSPK